MKKHNLIFSIVTSFCLMLSAMFILTACGNKAPKCFYFTVDALPVHVEEVFILSTTGGKGSDDKGDFLVEGDIAEVWFNIEEGYNLGTLKVLSNGEELTLSEDGEHCYKATFEPTEDFAITFTGTVAPKVANVRIAYGSMYSGYHDRIMVEIDRYDLFGLEKEKMNFSEFKEAVGNIGNSVFPIDYDTPVTFSVYTTGEYDFAISETAFVDVLQGGYYAYIGYKSTGIEKIADEENQKYGYIVTIRFYSDCTVKINDEVLTEYNVEFVHDWDNVSMNKDLFALSVNGDDRAVVSNYYYIQGVIKFSDFLGSELPKLKIDFLKYDDENYKNFYDALTFDLAGTSAQRNADGSYVEIEFDKYYKYDFKTARYIVSTNALELLKTMDKVIGKSSQIVDKIEMDGIEDSSQFGYIDVASLIKDKCIGRSNEDIVYFLKNEVLTFTIDFYSEVNYKYVRFGEVLVEVGSTWNSDVSVKKEQYDYDGETKASRYTITVRASIATEKIEFFTDNPDTDNLIWKNKIFKTYNGKRQDLIQGVDFSTSYREASITYKLKDSETNPPSATYTKS